MKLCYKNIYYKDGNIYIYDYVCLKIEKIMLYFLLFNYMYSIKWVVVMCYRIIKFY